MKCRTWATSEECKRRGNEIAQSPVREQPERGGEPAQYLSSFSSSSLLFQQQKGNEGNLPTLPEAIQLLQLEKTKVVQSKITIVNMTNVMLQNNKVSKEAQGLLEAPAKIIKKANLEIDDM